MLDVEQTIKNLIGMEVDENREEFYNDVICAFEGNEEDIIIQEAVYLGLGGDIDYVAHENKDDGDGVSVFICIDEGKIEDAWAR